MEVKKLKPGASAPNGMDFIRLTHLATGKTHASASFGGEVVEIGTYDTEDDAQRAAIHRAVGQAVFPLYIEFA